MLLFSLYPDPVGRPSRCSDQVFKSYVDDDRFSTVYISPKMFQLVSKIKINDMDADLQQLLKIYRDYTYLVPMFLQNLLQRGCLQNQYKRIRRTHESER
ncbi:MAG: DUF4252 domain-containing protein [Saprospiraceae bacterium]|nr:DUF4252 domain-containing protein [Saprospiraceae bacterium]